MKMLAKNNKNIVFILLTIFVSFSLFIIGCGEADDDLPDTVTVQVEIPSTKVLSSTDAIKLIVSTNFSFSGSPNNREIKYNTKEEFIVTQDFENTFTLDPDKRGIAVELVNNSSEFVRLTLLPEGEVESSTTIKPNGRYQGSRTWTQITIN